jgi:superfamily II DNA or RNA helicase
MSEERRLNSSKLRSVLWMHADGKCQICAQELQPGWHADHVTPWRLTKKTNVHEMQALCQVCNLKKGGKVMKNDRQHVAILKLKLGEIESRDLPIGRPYKILNHVVPGGGKTATTGVIAKQFARLKVGIIVPRVSLMRQTVQTMQEWFGIKLREIQGNSESLNPCRSERGWVTTYQTIINNPDLWANEIKRHEYILTLDECHHCNGGNGYDSAMSKVVAKARIVNLMTGTLETSADRQIGGIPYRQTAGGMLPELPELNGSGNDGIDLYIRYSRREALLEDAIVPMRFHWHDGLVEFEEGGVVKKMRLNEAPEDDKSSAVYTALNTQLAKDLLWNGVQHWKQTKRPQDKLLVVVDSQPRAKEYRDLLLSWGVHSGLAISDEPEAHSQVQSFRESVLPALVSVQMAYEGLDVPAISHLICLTHIRSRPWIEQALARAWRATGNKIECHAFVPQDPMMVDIIQSIEADQQKVLQIKAERGSVSQSGTKNNERLTVPIGSELDTITQTHLDEDIKETKTRDMITERLRDIPGITDEFIQQCTRQHMATSAVATPTRRPALTVREQEKSVRNQLHKKLCKKALDESKPVDTYLKVLNRAMNFKRFSEMSLNELERARDYAIRHFGIVWDR